MRNCAELMSRLLVAASVVLAATSAHAEASYPETFRLVRSMREDELMMAGLHAKAEEELRANKDNRRAACLANTKYLAITDGIALVISSQLTEAELAEGIAFYRSPTGRKVVEQSFREIIENQLADPAALSKEEQAVLRKFQRRPAGRKLLDHSIAQQPAVIQKVGTRVKMAVDDCLNTDDVQDPDDTLSIYAKACATAPLVSPDNACSVEQRFETYSPPHASQRTAIYVDCVKNGSARSETVMSFDGHVQGLGVRWLNDSAIEIAMPRGLKQTDSGPSRTRVQLKEIPKAGPPQQCWPVSRASDSNLVDLNSNQAQPFWMTYADSQRCLLGKRNDTARRPWVVQFRKVKATERPFGTTQLVFFESFSTRAPTRSVSIQGPGTAKVELKSGGPSEGFRLVGAPAENLLKQLTSGVALTMEIQPAEGEAFSVPLDRTDLDWAQSEFESCMRAL